MGVLKVILKHATSPYNILSLSCKQVMEYSNVSGKSCHFDSTPISCYKKDGDVYLSLIGMKLYVLQNTVQFPGLELVSYRVRIL